MAGLTPEGFIAKRTPDIKVETEQALIDRFGAVNLNPSSVFGQLVGLTTDQQVDLWNKMEEVYWSQYPSSATGVNLDRMVSINGLTRLPARATVVRGVVSGVPSTVLAVGRLVGSTVTGEQYSLQSGLTINAAASVGAQITIPSPEDNTEYTINLGGVAYTIDSGGLATEASILTALRNALPVWVETDLVTGSLENHLEMEYDTAQEITLSGNIGLEWVSNFADFVGTRTGPIAVPVHALNQIITPVAGWLAVDNRFPGTDGRNAETDMELRLRRVNSLRLSGQNTLEAVISHLQQVPGVLALRVIANNGTTTDGEGIPPQHVRAIVDGGTNEDIARSLFTNVAGGIGYFGDVTQSVISEVSGQAYEVKFDRPTNVPFYITVVIQSTAQTPTNVVEMVRAELMAANRELNIAEPVLYTRLFTPINKVIGAGAYVDELYINTVPISAPEDELTDNLIPEPDERMVLAPERIQVFVLTP